MNFTRKVKDWINKKLDQRLPSWQGYVDCYWCLGRGKNYTKKGISDCWWCNGRGEVYKHGPQRRTLRERLCFHCWIMPIKKWRFCQFCGLQQRLENTGISNKWVDIWSFRDADLLEAAIWYYSHKQKKLRENENRTWGEIKDLYQDFERMKR